MQASHYPFSIFEPQTDFEKEALMPIGITESKNECKQAITNSAFLNSWLIFRNSLGAYDTTKSKSMNKPLPIQHF
jgi:hypothetical protein